MSANGNSTFHYFAYGSNLSPHRLSLSAPSLKKVGIGKLERFTMKFAFKSARWNGGVATVHESENHHDCVWGVVWKIDLSHSSALDKQEGVSEGVYQPLQVEIKRPNGLSINCRTYQLTDLGGKHQYAEPSPQYHGLILAGAIGNNFPEEYIAMLQNIKVNTNAEITEVMKKVSQMSGNDVVMKL